LKQHFRRSSLGGGQVGSEVKELLLVPGDQEANYRNKLNQGHNHAKCLARPESLLTIPPKPPKFMQIPLVKSK